MTKAIGGVLLTLFAFLSAGCETSKEFTQALSVRQFSFPKDHGTHEEFQTEWWYFTGHLYADGNRPFKDKTDYGFEITFFRFANDPGGSSSLMAHGALTDVKNEAFYHEQRFALPKSGLGTFSRDGLAVSTQDWRGSLEGEKLQLQYNVRGCTVSLSSIEFPQPLLNGDAGLSHKSKEAGKASYYYSVPRIQLEGDITCTDRPAVHVHGLAWMDHEFMSQGMAADKEGWDWFSLFNKDGSSVMLYRLRGKEPSADFLSGTVLLSDGKQRRLNADDFSLNYKSKWKSRATGAEYPSKFHIEVPSVGLSKVLTPLVPDQEIVSVQGVDSPAYWEGAIVSEDQSTIGYGEFTGYEKGLGDRF